MHRLEMTMADSNKKYRVTVEELVFDEEGKEIESEAKMALQFVATQVDFQQRKGNCQRLFARSCNCASCLVLARNMQKESTR